MFVQTNVAALNAWQSLVQNQNQMSNTLEQLSTGYRINSAADDPAGLAISEQMSSQISGLNQANQNAQSGITLLQTADGALGQIQSILQSMRSLASEAATSTMNSTDTENLQQEMNQYAQEITNISNDTQFNNLNLLGGDFGTSTNPEYIQIGANQGQTLGISLAAADAYSLGVTGQTPTISNAAAQTTVDNSSTLSSAGLPTDDSYTMAAAVTPWSMSISDSATPLFVASTSSITAAAAVANTASDTATVSVSTAGAAGSKAVIAVTDNSTGVTTDYTATANGTTSTFDNVLIGGNTFTFTGLATGSATSTANLTLNPTQTVYTLTNTNTGQNATDTVYGVTSTGTQESVQLGNGSLTFGISSTAAAQTDAGSTLTVTDNAGDTKASSAAPAALTTADLTIAQSGSAGSGSNGVLNSLATATTAINITSTSDAQAAITVIDDAINTVSSQRAVVGAYQNELQFAASDAQTSQLNLTSAQGTIMDADMALDMANLSQEQVLQQSGVAMLAQANAVPQALLKLLP